MIRAIIADDEQAVASIICHFIEKEYIPIKIVGMATDGRQAVKLIREQQPELVFLDIQMPFMNGFEVMQTVADTHFIIITAYESFQYAQQALRLGACDIILKPIEYKQFIQAITRAIGWKFTSNKAVNEILEYLHLNYTKKISLSQLAIMFYTTPSHMAKLFKSYMGISIITYVHQLRINEAKRLLTEQRCSVKETAERTGYDSLNNFYKYFKIHTGMTPAMFTQKDG